VETKTADELKGGADYSSFFSERSGWFVRQELERDNVEDVDLRSTTDAGFTYRLIKTERQQLVSRSVPVTALRATATAWTTRARCSRSA
jgi:hypothetical protein